MTTLNLGIVAHVDAGKTTLTERLLFETGVITAVGRVDHGDTITDSDALERQRGITIRSGVVTFRIGDLKVNLIDTPGHSDFVAEVERALGVLDGAVLVVSAVEGVQAQTRILIRIMEQLEIPFVVFVNKIDRVGADYDDTLAALLESVSGALVPLTLPREQGSRRSYVEPLAGPQLTATITEQIAEYDEAVLAGYVEGATVLTVAQADARLRTLTAEGRLHPTYAGAALHGVGVEELIAGIARYLRPHDGPEPGSLHGQVFKIEPDRRGGPKVAFARVRAGTLASRDHVTYHRRSQAGQIVERSGRASAVRILERGRGTIERTAEAGDIAAVVGLPDIQIGDQLGRWDASLGGQHFAQPGLEAVVIAVHAHQRPDLYDALRQLSEQDPLIAARLDGLDEELTVSLYGEVQKEVLMARLAEEFGVEARFLPTRTVHVERVCGIGEAFDVIGNFNATVGLRIEAGAIGSGFEFRLGIERGWLLPSHHTAIEKTLATEIQTGVFGWRVIDAVVTQTQGRFRAPIPPAGFFRQLTSTTFRRALRQAGTHVCEPISEFEVEFPAAVMSQMVRELVAAGATPNESATGPTRGRITGTMPTAAVHGLEQRLPNLTAGRGILLTEPGGYRPVSGPPPDRHQPRVRADGS